MATENKLMWSEMELMKTVYRKDKFSSPSTPEFDFQYAQYEEKIMGVGETVIEHLTKVRVRTGGAKMEQGTEDRKDWLTNIPFST
jgi:hypothetical protein